MCIIVRCGAKGSGERAEAPCASLLHRINALSSASLSNNAMTSRITLLHNPSRHTTQQAAIKPRERTSKEFYSRAYSSGKNVMLYISLLMSCSLLIFCLSPPSTIVAVNNSFW
eukprot:1185075-Prorocentrum_minimum.AAC.3